MLELYKSIQKDNKADIYCGYAFVKTRSAIYTLVSTMMSFLSDCVFFPGYKKAHYYTPLKIFRRDLLFKEHQWLKKNIYFFWNFNPSRIRSIGVAQHERFHGSGNYNLWRYLDFYKHIMLKMLQKLILGLMLLTVIMVIFGWRWEVLLAVLGSESAILLIIRILLKKWHSEQGE